MTKSVNHNKNIRFYGGVFVKKLLIIDDEFIFRQGLKYMMDWESCGYTIIGEASNGQEGFDLCMNLEPDIILCDVVMPILNGVEFVRKLQSVDGPPVIMLSNFDEYDKVRKAFQYGASDYILKSQVNKEQLLSCFDRILSLKQKFSSKETEKTFGSLIRQILDGYALMPFQELQTYVQNRFPKGKYLLLLIDSPHPDFQSESHLSEEMHRIALEFPVCSAYTTQHHAICLIHYPMDADSSTINHIFLNLENYIQHTSCALSLPFDSLSKIKEIAEDLYEITKYSVLFEDKLCFYEPEIRREEDNTESFPSEEYYSYISTGRIPEACHHLLTYLDSMKNSYVNPYRFRKFIEHTFYISLKELRKLSNHSQKLSLIELKLFKQMDSALTFIHIRDAIAGAFGELDSLYIKPKHEDYIILELKNYLEENYSHQITLYDVAESLHMNYSYLSAYISQNTGKHFSEHLNDTRIRHAKEMLSNTSHSISFISETIGYTDQSYFGKVFKKLVGVTPLQYRNYDSILQK